MICLFLNRFVCDPSCMFTLSQFVWTLRSSVWIVFNNILLIDATDRSKISSDTKWLFFAVSLYPHSFFANTPFKFKNIKLLTLYFWLLLWTIYFVLQFFKILTWVCSKTKRLRSLRYGKFSVSIGKFSLL